MFGARAVSCEKALFDRLLSSKDFFGGWRGNYFNECYSQSLSFFLLFYSLFTRIILFFDCVLAFTLLLFLLDLFEISNILNTGLDRETLAILVNLCESGVHPEALAAVVKELRREAAAVALEEQEEESETSTA